MARLNGDKIYRITKGDLRLDFYASDNTSNLPSSPTVVNLSPNCLVEWSLENEFDGLPIGVMSLPILSITFNINLTGSAFNTLLKDAFRTYTVSSAMPTTKYITGSGISPETFNITAGNVFELYIENTLSFVGIQKTSVEGNYDSENYLFTVEAWHVARIVSENIPMTVLNQLAALKTDSDAIRQSQVCYDMIFKDTTFTNLGSNNLFVRGSTPAKIGTEMYYFYFVKANEIYNLLNMVYDYALLKVTRNRRSNLAGLPEFDTYELFKQSYLKTFERSNTSVINNDSSVYVLGFVANQPLSNRVSGTFFIADTIVNKLENYQNVFDFYLAHAKASFVRMFGTVTGFTYQKMFTAITWNVVNSSLRERAGIELDYNVLRQAEASSVEKYENDTDKIEVKFAGSRSSNTDNMTVVFNNNIIQRKNVGDNSIYIDMFRTGDFWQYFKINNLNRVIAIRHFTPLFLAYYYFEQPNVDGDNLTTEAVPILFNHNVNIIFGEGYDSDLFNDEILQTQWADVSQFLFVEVLNGNSIDLGQRSGGFLYNIANSYLQLYKTYSDDTQTTNQQMKVTAKINPVPAVNRELANGYGHRISYDPSLLAPPNDTTFFDNTINEMYMLKYKLDLNCYDANNRKPLAEVEFISRSFDV